MGVYLMAKSMLIPMSKVWARPLSPKRRTFYATAYNNCVFTASNLSTVWKGPSPDVNWLCPCTQSQVHKEVVFPVFCGRTWPAQSPDLNLIKHLLDELECQLWVRPYHPTSVLDLTNALVAELEKICAAKFQILMESLKQKGGGCYSSKLMPMVLECHVQHSHIGVMFVQMHFYI